MKAERNLELGAIANESGGKRTMKDEGVLMLVYLIILPFQ